MGSAMAALVIAIGTQMALYADGPFYLLWTLHHRYPMDFDYSRQFAQTLTQYPVSYLARHFAPSISQMRLLFEIFQYLPYAVSFLICAFALRQHHHLLIFPLLSFAAAGLNASLFIVSESHVLAALFWPLACFLTVDEKPGKIGWLLLLACAVPILRCYESMVFLGGWLALLAGHRALVNRRHPIAIAYLALTLWFLAGMAIAAYWIIYPREPENLGSISQALSLAFADGAHLHIMAIATWLAIVLLVGGACPAIFWRHLNKYWLGPAILVPVAALWFIVHLDEFMPTAHYQARILNLIAPLLLAPIMWAGYRLNAHIPVRIWVNAARATLGIVIGQLFATAAVAQSWTSYLTEFNAEIGGFQGICALEVLGLSQGPFARWNWSWTMPTMSAVLSEGPIRAVVANPAGSKVWVPFDPMDARSLPDLSRYGLRWDLREGKCLTRQKD
jgi:hypothetical protein